MSQDAQHIPRPDGEHGWVSLHIEACMGWLAVTVEINGSALTLPAEHPKVHTCESDGLPGINGLRPYRHFESLATLQGRYQANEIIGERFEFGAYTTTGDSYDNTVTQDLLGCFIREDRKRITYALDALAAYRDIWWRKTLEARARKLNKKLSDLTEADLGRLITKTGHRNYPLFGQNPGYDASPALRVNRRHLETELRALVNCLLAETLVGS